MNVVVLGYCVMWCVIEVESVCVSCIVVGEVWIEKREKLWRVGILMYYYSVFLFLCWLVFLVVVRWLCLIILFSNLSWVGYLCLLMSLVRLVLIMILLCIVKMMLLLRCWVVVFVVLFGVILLRFCVMFLDVLCVEVSYGLIGWLLRLLGLWILFWFFIFWWLSWFLCGVIVWMGLLLWLMWLMVVRYLIVRLSLLSRW